MVTSSRAPPVLAAIGGPIGPELVRDAYVCWGRFPLDSLATLSSRSEDWSLGSTWLSNIISLGGMSKIPSPMSHSHKYQLSPSHKLKFLQVISQL